MPVVASSHLMNQALCPGLSLKGPHLLCDCNEEQSSIWSSQLEPRRSSLNPPPNPHHTIHRFHTQTAREKGSEEDRYTMTGNEQIHTYTPDSAVVFRKLEIYYKFRQNRIEDSQWSHNGSLLTASTRILYVNYVLLFLFSNTRESKNNDFDLNNRMHITVLGLKQHFVCGLWLMEVQ